MSRDAPHRVHGDGSPDHLVVLAPGPIDPGSVQHDFLLEGCMSQLGGDATRLFGGHGGALGHGFWRIIFRQVSVRHDFEHGSRLALIRQVPSQ